MAPEAVPYCSVWYVLLHMIATTFTGSFVPGIRNVSTLLLTDTAKIATIDFWQYALVIDEYSVVPVLVDIINPTMEPRNNSTCCKW